MDNLKSMSKDGTILSPSMQEEDHSVGDFYQDLIKDLGPDSLKKYGNSSIDIQEYVQTNRERLLSTGKPGTKRVIQHWEIYNKKMKLIPDKLDGESLFRDNCVWVGDEDDGSHYADQGGGYFEFNMPKNSVSFGKGNVIGVVPEEMDLKDATKLIISDSSKKGEFETILKEKGLSHISVEITES